MWMALLPVDVFSNAVLPFLRVRDLRVLQSACSQSRLLRSHLDTLLTSYYYDCMGEPLDYDDISWLWDAKVNVTSVVMEWISSSDMMCLLMNKVLSFSTLKSFCSEEVIPGHLLKMLAAACPQLEKLQVRCNHFSNGPALVQALAQHCPQLQTLVLRERHLCGDDTVLQLCDLRENFPLLNRLICESVVRDDTIRVLVSSYPHMRSLHFLKSFFGHTGLLAIADKCHELESITISCSADDTSKSLAAVWAVNPNLTDVHISGNGFISDDDIIVLLLCCPQLKKLNLTYCENITNTAVIAVAEHCPQLTSLNISDCYRISDDALIALGQHCHGLKSIDISYITKISDVGIAALAAGCPLLQEFIAIAANLSDAGVIALAGCRDLRKIDIRHCCFIGLDAISAIAENCPLISELYLYGCECVFDSCLQIVLERLHNLSKLNVTGTKVTYPVLKNR